VCEIGTAAVGGALRSVERQESESEERDLLRRAPVRSSLRRLLVRRFCGAPWSGNAR
jgi:hypothetical protein